MTHYLLLSLLTLAIVYLGVRIWKQTREPGFLLVLALLYYWTLLGSWFLIYDDLTGGKGIEWGLSYYVYTEILFPVHADTDYLLTILSYGFFIISAEAVILWMTRKPKNAQKHEFSRIRISHGWIIAGSVAAVLISFGLVWTEILTAAKFEHSIYVVTRQMQGPWYTIHQLLNQAAVTGIFLGFLIRLSGPNAKWISGDTKKTSLIAYAFALPLVVTVMLLLGNKKELMSAGIFGLLFLYRNTGKFDWRKYAVFLSFVVFPFVFNNGMRAWSPVFLTQYFDVSGLHFELEKPISYTRFTLKSSALSFVFSNEIFCSHMSLYGLIKKDPAYTWGSSLLSLSASVVPRALWPDRPPPVYEEYARIFKLPKGQGLTIHHAAAWYLNFGYTGIIAGGVLLGFLLSLSYRMLFRITTATNLVLKILFLMAFIGFVSQVPSLIRSGPEAYKIVVFEGILIPLLWIFFSHKFAPKIKKE